jgi:hypothetical protein
VSRIGGASEKTKPRRKIGKIMTALKGILLLCVSIIPLTLPGCSPILVEEIAQGVTVGIIHELEDRTPTQKR